MHTTFSKNRTTHELTRKQAGKPRNKYTYFNMPEVFIDITPGTQPNRIFYKYIIKTNAGQQSLSYMAIDIWKDLPSSLKDLSVFVFPK